MSSYHRLYLPGHTYFFTVVASGRQPVFRQEMVRGALRSAFAHVRSGLAFSIPGFVLLPDHLHTIWTLPEGDSDYSTRWRLIKTRVTQACGARIWQPRYWEHAIRDDADLHKHLDYIHWNPVKHGIVASVRDWPWSSFHRYVKFGAYPADWCAGRGLDEINLE
ncbi:REP-associated tyrosine transposase [Pseudoduganella ginsengisoli]|uniref:Transposase n=1 Tax=Pseudoduganella ginsengisoli TaxID=1462440 RepID=A0A6L6PSH5_9BURK|nr:transposase [Pseudoduganella ginsengisoli]MTW00483.1 transposase [Pseudoduganella ginsengisoli]